MMRESEGLISMIASDSENGTKKSSTQVHA